MTDQPGCPCSICGEDANRTPTGSDPHTLRTRIAAIADRIIREGVHVDLPINVMADDLADAVIAEMRPQLAAWARMCVDSGDMTPMAQRLLHNILGQA